MSERVASSTVPPLPATTAPHPHAAALVGSDDELLAAALPFLEQGLAAGDTTLLACPPGTAGLIADGLGMRAADVENHPGICLLGSRVPDALALTRRLVDVARGTGSGRARLVGQVQFGERTSTRREGERYEAAANLLLAGQPLAVMCLYDSRSLPEAVLDSARQTHPQLAAGATFRDNADFGDPLAFLHGLPVVREPFEDGAPVLTITGATVLADLRHRIGAALAVHVRDPELADDLHLGASEVAANAFRHGRPPVSVRLWVGPDHLVCEISDCGTKFADPLAGFEPAHGPDLGRGGMGLWLARKLFDHVDLIPQPDGLTVRLATRLR